jgi:hypothetical protein
MCLAVFSRRIPVDVNALVISSNINVDPVVGRWLIKDKQMCKKEEEEGQ